MTYLLRIDVELPRRFAHPFSATIALKDAGRRRCP
jgi:hypothetical protein